MATDVQPLTLDRDVARAIELLEKLQETGDVPGHKLQSLKMVLQSEFCTAIREQEAAGDPISSTRVLREKQEPMVARITLDALFHQGIVTFLYDTVSLRHRGVMELG
ncbi:hypothetical protein DPEC_G00113930 [Dallia pectoralis]|uniref:Uncharacterized protein n=1 Tax=Dallia pectoralis TaxID=75939 RepID=A0ACC2GU67_DALPE|nr:hypothetical protein DPEC_G00113930 [Dallia pectoralis]